jgi:hypothetical protein
MTITLMQLQKPVSELFPLDHQSLTRIPVAWARKDPGGELRMIGACDRRRDPRQPHHISQPQGPGDGAYQRF